MKSFLQYISEDEQPKDADYAGAPEQKPMSEPELELYYQSWLRDKQKPILKKKTGERTGKSRDRKNDWWD